MVNYWSNITQCLLPEKCFLCQCSHSINAKTGLCFGCASNLPWLQQSCQRCALPLNSTNTLQLCGQCQTKAPAFDACHCLFHYETPVDRLISRFKFNQHLSYSRLLGQLMAEHIKNRYREITLPDMIIPVPLHKSRLRERGFNQAQEVARICARELNLPLETKQCQRDKDTAHQLGLSAIERRRNLRRAFNSKAFPAGARVALVDDVMTTGTTLNELAACLKKVGCQEIHLWCIARAYHL